MREEEMKIMLLGKKEKWIENRMSIQSTMSIDVESNILEGELLRQGLLKILCWEITIMGIKGEK